MFKRIGAQVAWWGWIPAGYTLIWAFLHFIIGGVATASQSWDQFYMANFWSGSVLLWVYLLVGCIGSAIIWAATSVDDHNPADTVMILAALGAAVFCVISLVGETWDNDKQGARYYNASTVFHSPSTSNPPSSLSRLISGAKVGTNGCELVGAADVPSCVQTGSLSSAGWQPRIGSLDGAVIALSRTSGFVQNVSLDENSLAYLNAWHGQSPAWSGILDGHGYSQPLGGVSEWSGQGNPTSCFFTGKYAVNRAFHGGHMNSLPNLLAERYPAMRWSSYDVWGYCDGQEPVVVIPMTRQIYKNGRTVDTAAGIVVLTGDHGKTVLTYHADVKPGEYPGPVYPSTLAATQRVDTSWAAGRLNMNRGGFGFEPTSSQAQAGNVSEYLLSDAATGRLEYVTPLTLRSSSSDLFVAYSIVPADQVSANHLNTIDVWALANNDPRELNIDNLDAQARTWLATQDPGFFSSGGKLVEFTPIDGDLWRAFGEINGRVEYRLDISASNRVAPTLVSLDQSAAAPAQAQVTNQICGTPISSLTPAQLAGCAKQFADALASTYSKK